MPSAGAATLAVARRDLGVQVTFRSMTRELVTPEDEHHGRGEAIRKARRDGLHAARANRIATRRQMRQTHPETPSPDEDI
jgi:hypothetical protein